MTNLEQMFHYFEVYMDHQNFLCFCLYCNTDLNDVVEWRMLVHTFGNSPSPSVAMYGLRRAGRENTKQKQGSLLRVTYMLMMVWSLPTENEIITLLLNTQDMLTLSNLWLHWILTHRVAVMRAFPPEGLAEGLKDLDLNTDLPHMQRSPGERWDITEDVFTFQRNQTKGAWSCLRLKACLSFWDMLPLSALSEGLSSGSTRIYANTSPLLSARHKVKGYVFSVIHPQPP